MKAPDGYSNFKASHVLLKEVPKSLENLYEHTHQLANMMTDLLLAMYQSPYSFRSQNDQVEISIEEIHARLSELSINTDNDRRLAKNFVDGLFEVIPGFKNAENGTALLFADETKLNVFKRVEYKTLKKGQEEKWTLEEFKKNLPKRDDVEQTLSAFTDEEWNLYLSDEALLKKFASELLTRSCPIPKAAGIKLRELGIFPIKFQGFDYDLKLFNSVIYAVSQRIKQWIKASNKCSDRKIKCREEFENKKITAGRLYQDFEKFAEYLESVNYGITKKLVVDISNNRNLKYYSPFLEILNKDEYIHLKNNFFKLGSAYLAKKKWLDAKESATFCAFSSEHSPFTLRFGQTGRGYPFTMASINQELCFTIKKHEERIGIVGYQSRYFSKPWVELNKDNNYDFNFVRKGNGDKYISTVVNELGLFKKRGKFYFTISFKHEGTPVQEHLGQARKYFNSALCTPQTLPVGEVTVMGVDLGMRPLFAYSVAKLDQFNEAEISCPVAGMKDVSFFESGFKGNIANKSLYDQLRDLAEICYYGPKFMSVTKNIRDGKSIDEIRLKYFNEEFVPKFGCSCFSDEKEQFIAIRNRISEIVLNYKKLVKQFSLRDIPKHKTKNWEFVSSEWSEMLKLIKNIKSLLNSWSRYHLKKDEFLHGVDLSSYDRHYQNLRLDMLRKMVAYIVNTAISVKANIVVVEDLSIVDRDDEVKSRKDNSLRAIWSPLQLLGKLEHELWSKGIVMVKVDPHHTSQLSAVTNEFGKRGNQYSKDFIYFFKNNQMYRMQSDINASMNIVRRFLTRYSSLSYLYARKVDDSTYVIPEKGKIQTSFIESKVDAKFAILIENADGFELQKLTRTDYNAYLEKSDERVTKFYRHENTWLKQTEHRAKIKVLEDQASAIGYGNVPIFNV